MLVKQNPKCSTIPIDSNATETGYKFEEKVDKYITKKNKSVKIQNF